MKYIQRYLQVDMHKECTFTSYYTALCNWYSLPVYRVPPFKKKLMKNFKNYENKKWKLYCAKISEQFVSYELLFSRVFNHKNVQ